MRGDRTSQLLLMVILFGSSPVLSGGGSWMVATNALDRTVEVRVPLGENLTLPAGQYLVRREEEWAISPYSFLQGNGIVGEQREQYQRALYPVVGGGRVSIPDYLRSADLQLRVLPLGDYRDNRAEGARRWDLFIHRPTQETGEGILVPAGRSIALLWHTREKRYVAFTKPFAVREREVVEAQFVVPQSAALFLDVARRYPYDRENDAVGVWFEAAQETQKPEVVVETAERVYAFWPVLEKTRGVVRADTKDQYLRELVALENGGIAAVSNQLAEKARLKVRIAMPSGLAAESAVELRTAPLGEVVERKVVPKSGTVEFDDLWAGSFDVVLVTSRGRVTRPVELNPGAEGEVSFTVGDLRLWGKVAVGGETLATTIRFTTIAGDVSEVLTDEDGRYDTRLVEPAGMVQVELPQGAPFIDFLRPPIRESRELDFDLPGGAYVVRVKNRASGEAVVSAAVTVRNAYTIEVDGGEPKQRVVAQTVAADEKGVARLAPPRPGSLSVTALAPGFRPLAQPLESTIDEDAEGAEILVELEPRGEHVRVHLRLASGSAASLADIRFWEDGQSLLEPLQADSKGDFDLPRGATGTVMVRHPQAAFLVARWEAGDADDVEWALPAPPADPLQVRVVDAAGDPVPQAELAVWSGGSWLSGDVLGFLTNGSARTDSQGYWISSAVPPTLVGVLAWRASDRAAGQGGSFDEQAVPVPYPRVAVVHVPLAE